ncbi:hypothetical protein ACFFLM_24520 [Deinococcus oregonensis]|uniref:Uncharacterized protein n=1 Tax=Deinococcus oregonensis TaxID=1805970 RepID=A0ABV6B5S0_9DEIO
MRTLLAIDRAVTTVQLRRWGLLDAATWLRLPQVTYTVRTRTTQRASGVDLTFVCADADTAGQASRELMHYAGLAEVRQQYDLSKRPGLRWRHIDERRTESKADAEILGPPGDLRPDTVVEFDAGYSTQIVQIKLEAFAVGGYTGMIWATSSLGRARNIHRQFTALEDKGLLQTADIIYVNFWDDGDPYVLSPRNHKAVKLTWSARAT